MFTFYEFYILCKLLTNMVKSFKCDKVLIASTTIKNETKQFYRFKISEV